MFSKQLLFILTFLFANLCFSHEDEGRSRDFPFMENKGQWHENVFYRTALNKGVIYFEKDAFHYQISQYKHSGHTDEKDFEVVEKTGTHAFKAHFINTTSKQTLSANHRSSEYYNFYLGDDPSKWKSEVRAYKNVNYQNLYKGIDLKVYFNGETIKYDYLVEAGASPEQIRVKYEGVEKPSLKNNSLQIKHEFGTMIESEPYAYQIIDGKAIAVDCNYHIDKEGIVTFRFPKGYDESKRLVIDPELIFSTYSGSPSSNFGMTATFDSEGNGYVGGCIYSSGRYYTISTGFFQRSYQGGSSDIVISKFNASDASQLLYSTYLGGKEADIASSLVVDKNDNLLLLSTTSSGDFPTSKNAYSTVKNYSAQINLSQHMQNFKSGNDIAITKLSKDGTSLLASTFFGGTDSDGLNIDKTDKNNQDTKLLYNHGDYFRGEIIVDSSDNVYIGSSSHSTDIDSVKNSHSGKQDGIIAKFNSDLSQLYWARYLGGSEDDAIYSLKLIKGNRILVGGGTRSYNNFPTTTNAYKATAGGGRADGFISIISKDGNTIEKSTFIGTEEYDQVYFVEHDRFDNIYAFGTTRSKMFPIKNSTIANDSTGQFIIKLDPNLDSLEISHVFGVNSLIPHKKSTINISPTAFLVDRCMNMYISGWGGSVTGNEGSKTLYTTMPLKQPFQNNTDNKDFYLYAINRNADSLIFASFLGGDESPDHVDGGTSRFDKNGIIYQGVCASCGTSTKTYNDFPTTANAYARSKGVKRQYGCNSALFKYDFEIAPVADFKLSKSNFCLSNGDTIAIKITNKSKRGNKITWDFYGTEVVSDFIDTTIFFTQSGNYVIRQTVQDTICILGNYDAKIINIRPDNIKLNLQTSDSVICYTDSVEIIASSAGAATNFTWDTLPSFKNGFSSTDSIHTFKLKNGINTFYIKAENVQTNECAKMDSISVFYSPSIASINIMDSVCENKPLYFQSVQQNVDSFRWDFGDGQYNSSDTNLFHNYSSTGTFNVNFVYQNNLCPKSDTLHKEVTVKKNNLKFDSFKDSLYCGTGDFEVKVSSLGSAKHFLWSTQRDFSDTLNNLETDSSIIIKEDGRYQYYIKISDGVCTLTDSIESIYHKYDISLPPLVEDSVCSPYTLELNPSIIGLDDFRINYGNGNYTTTDSTPSINYNQKGKYIIELIGSSKLCNRKDTITEEITVFESVRLEALMDTTICYGDSISLKANAFGTAQEFLWDTTANFTNPLNAPQDSVLKTLPKADTTIYYLRGINHVCQTDTFVKVHAEEILMNLSPYEMLCLGDTINLLLRTLKSNYPLFYNWTPEDSLISGQNTKEVSLAPDSSMLLKVESSNSLGCKSIDSTLIEVAQPAFTSAQIFAVDSAYRGQKIKLSSNRSGGNLLYAWEPKSLMDNPRAAEPIMTIYETTTVTLSIYDINTGCLVETQKRIKVYEILCGEPEIFIPTAFTPNNDGKNDVLYVRGKNLADIELKIYNRWGELVFESNDLKKGWDGSYKGQKAAPAVYVYHLKATCLDQQTFFKKGNITLIR